MKEIPPKLRLLFTVAAAGGFIFIVMGTLAGNGQHNVSLDKLVHGVGYGLLGILIVLGVPPVLYIPALLGISAAGAGLEFAQKLMMPNRQFEIMDMVFNTAGLAVGMAIGFLARLIWNSIQSELNTLSNRKRLINVLEGEELFAVGEDSEFFFMIISGKAELLQGDADAKIIVQVGPGDLVGEMAAIEGQPHTATAIARSKMLLFKIERSDIESQVGDSEHPALAVARVLASRVRSLNRELALLTPQPKRT
jgi:hypothetical protein